MTQTELTPKETLTGKWKAYPAYKDSGVEWLGKIPEHWDVARLKLIARLSYGDSLPADAREAGDIPVFGSNGPVGFHSEPNTLAPVLVIGRKGSFGKVNFSDLPCFAIDTTYYIDAKNSNADLRWLFYAMLLLRLDTISEDSAIPGLSRELAEKQWLPVMSLPEQRSIATFLDRETAKINALITKKERLIKLLQEKRAALISHAVTKGLDPTIPMKDSGVEWLGEIPEHWEVKRLKFCLDSIEQGWSPPCENRPAELDEWGVLKVGCVNGVKFNPDENKTLPAEIQPITEFEIMQGDVLVSRANTRELLGSASVVSQVRPHLLLCDKLYRLKILPNKVNSDFLVFAMGSGIIRFQLERDATGASNSMQNISQGTILNLEFSLPDIYEQHMITDYLNYETAKIDALISRIREGIEKLKEYSAALISAAVMGKIDVRGEIAIQNNTAL